jgi:phosphoribosyl-ATP pyrophosphohydrolase
MPQFLQELFDTIESRKGGDSSVSYTCKLFNDGVGHIARKVGEEAVETVVAALDETDEALISESSDLIYHLLVLLSAKNIKLEDVVKELKKRNDDESK